VGKESALTEISDYEKQLDGTYKAVYPVTRAEEQKGCLEVVFQDGRILRDMTLAQGRANVERNLNAE